MVSGPEIGRDASRLTPDRGLSTTFVEAGGQTTMVQSMRYASREVRDAVLRSPMEKGVAASYDKLAELLASQTA